jgi:hypothetical protein
VGAIVVNDQGQLLVVQEANGPLRGAGFNKMPTGLVHAGVRVLHGQHGAGGVWGVEG